MKNSKLIEEYDIQKKLNKDYWIKKISGINDSFIGLEGAGGSNRFNELTFDCNPAVISRVKTIAKDNPVNEYIIFLSFFIILQYKYYGCPQIIVSSPRLNYELDIDVDDDRDLLLFYTSTADEYQSIKKMFQDTRAEFHESIAYTGCDLKELHTLPGKKNIRNNFYTRFGFFDSRVNRESSEFERVSLQLKIEASGTGKLQTLVKYDEEIFSEDFIRRFISHYQNILSYVEQSLDTELGEIEILSPSEKKELLVDFNDTAAEYPLHQTIHGLFETQVSRTPDQISLVGADEGEEKKVGADLCVCPISLTYRQLNEQANRMAGLLMGKGVEPDTLVGIMAERSVETIIGILGILKAGGAYLPIDPEYPEDRIEFMLKDSGAKLLVVANDQMGEKVSVRRWEGEKVLLEEISSSTKSTSYPLNPSDLAYIIYTSGTTGKSKGVMVSHENVVRLFFNNRFQFDFVVGDVWTVFHSYCFDFSVWEMYGALLFGGKSILISRGTAIDAGRYLRIIKREAVTVLNQTPSAFYRLLEEELQFPNKLLYLRYVIFGGEALHPAKLKEWQQKYPLTKLINMYGITETTVHVTYKEITNKEIGTGVSNIGKPIPTLSIYIMDTHRHLLPVGLGGEIYVGGAGVARGYLNNPELSAEKFIKNRSYRSNKTYILYKTGDLGRWLPDGCIEYLGRLDFQVKIRGYRIECGEIENKLMNLNGINECIVVMGEDERSNQYLTAYFTALNEVTPWECHTYLEKILPDFMIPAYYVQLKQFPLTSTGKIDRKALPEPGSINLSKSRYEVPRNDNEKKLVKIWQEVLNVEDIGVNDNFFRLGGNSLLAIRVVNKIQEWVGEVIHVTALFSAPTVKELALQLEPYQLDNNGKVNEIKAAAFKKIIKPLPPLDIFEPKNPPAAFILSPPRCGTTLLRVILAGHPALFAPPELELLSFNTLADRKKELSGKFAYFAEGALRAIMEIKGCCADEAQSMMKEFEAQGLTSREFYRNIQQWLGNRLLVDKTPWYALNMDVLKRAEDYFEKPHYIHLLRNPYAAVHSFEKARLEQIFRYENTFSSRELAELVWLTCNQNILEFFNHIPAERKFTVRFEELVQDAEPIVRDICHFLAIDYREEMIKIYRDTGNKMIDGIFPESKMLGDINFFTHSAIDPGVKDKWRAEYKTNFLGDITVQLAKSLGYLEYSDSLDIHSIEIETAPRIDYYPLSPAQKRLWLLDQFRENNTAYNIPAVFRVEGCLNRKALEKTFETVIRRHESLRTTFTVINGEPCQKINDFEQIGFQLQDIDLKDRNDRENEADKVVRDLFNMPFDLQHGPLLKVIIIYLEEKKAILFINLHHIICDGWALRLLFEELMNSYEAYNDQKIKLLPPPRFQYKDYSYWINSENGKKIINRAAGFWLQEFSGEIPVLTLPTDFPRPTVQSFDGGIVAGHLEPSLTQALIEMALSRETTLFALLFALFNILLSKLTNQEDIIIGTPIAGRRSADMESIIGMFVNTLALRNQPVGEKIFSDFLKEVKKKILSAMENQDYQFEYLVEELAMAKDRSRNPLFDVMFVFQDTFIFTGEMAALETKSLKMTPYFKEDMTAKFDLTLTGNKIGDQLYFSIQYCAKLFREETVSRFMEYFKNIIKTVIDFPEKKISGIEITSDEERKKILYAFNETSADYPGDKTIHQLFEEQAEQTPDHIITVGAVGGEAKKRKREEEKEWVQLSYRELNNRSNHVATRLRSQGVNEGAIVGIMVEPIPEMSVGIIGILKAGGVFLPIDPGSPVDRIDFVIHDSNMSLLLTQAHLAAIIKTKIEIINLEDAAIYVGKSQNYLSGIEPGDPIYVIYTSGTTGRPKGVLIAHKNIVNYVYWFVQTIRLTAVDRAVLTSSFAFDALYTQFFSSLLTGCQLHVIPRETFLFAERLLDYLGKNKITYIKATPSLFNLVVNSPEFSLGLPGALRFVMLGGEEINVNDVEKTHRLYPHLPIMNHYGPTETTIGSIARFLDFARFEEYKTAPTIGKPLHNTRVYILDKGFNIVPIGVVGGLFIGGDGVGMGYLNKPELTAEKFFKYRSYRSNKTYIIYKTGDVARWHADGNIEFLGRSDDQVKIRGYRIELGEIERHLANYPEVKEVVLSVREEAQGGKYICAYIVSKKEISFSQLRKYLATHLPAYMIPSYIVNLDKIPLTVHGKVNRNALPGPQENSFISNVDYIPPQNAVEKKLVEIWEKVLGRANIGINENFFQVGGDSIKSIQIISRMNGAGYKLEMRDIFQYPVISELAPHVKKLKRIPDQSAITGIIPLTPIQEMFFAKSHTEPHYFNQCVMFYSRSRLNKEEIKIVFKKIQEHHDALRMTFEINKESGGIVQVDHGFDYPLSLEEYEITDLAGGLEFIAEKIQAGIHLEKGPMMKLGLFHLADGDRLLIVIHHMVIDGVSWRILFDDIETLYGQYKRGEKLVLPPKTDSFKLWSEKLSAYANSKPFLKEKTYWQKIEAIDAPSIPKDFAVADNYIRDTSSVSFSLGEEETNLLLTKVNRAYNTEVNDILLTALGLGIQKSFALDRVLIALEGHGREEVLEGLDISRTVGWFTSVYPVVMDICDIGDPGRQIKEIKETLRQVPNKGIGYGILKYLTAEENKNEIKFNSKPQITFNYLGQFDVDLKQISSFEPAKESTGNSQSQNNSREYLLQVSGMTTNNRLTMTISFNKTHFMPETIGTLAENFDFELRNLITFCSSRETVELTPADFTYKGLTIERIDRLINEYPGIEDIYTLTPMQEGMLFHAVADDSSYSYFQQVSYRLLGDLDIHLVEKSLNELFKRHDILRTAFVYKDIERPVQVVLKDRTSDFHYEDMRNMKDADEKENFIREFKTKDINRLFDLSKDVLMRVAIFRLQEMEYEFTWSHHHIIMDGWCLGILNSEFLEIYSGYLENRPYQLPGVKPYRAYIQWLEKQDKEESARYWKNYLDSFDEQTGVPRINRLTKEKNRTQYRNETVSLVLNMEKTNGLNKLATASHVTLNTLTQTLWGILLGKYNGTGDVVFGAVVSGRPSELEGIESMVGLFINTIPVRVCFKENMTFQQLLRQVQDEALAGEPHHYHPLAEIQSLSPLKQNLIDHLFIFENYPLAEKIEGFGKEKNSGNSIALELVNVQLFGQTNYDFNIVLGESEQLSITFQYNGNSYDRDFVERVAEHFSLAIDRVIKNQEVVVRELTFLSEQEKNRLLYEFNDTKTDYPTNKTIHRLFEEQAERTPDHIALIGHGEPIRPVRLVQLDYRHLNDQSNRLAGLLIEKGVLADSIVGIMVERTVEMIIGVMGILKAGGAYLPIEPDYPEDRIDYILKDSNTKIVITKSDFEFTSNFDIRALNFNSSNLAYLIYTSGSTGWPKGVAVEHSQLVNFIYHMYNRYDGEVGGHDRCLGVTNVMFDVSVWEFFLPLTFGAGLVLLPGQNRFDVFALAAAIYREDITLIYLPPALLEGVCERLKSVGGRISLNKLLVGVEPIRDTVLEQYMRLNPGMKIINGYGPTETTICATSYHYISHEPVGEIVPIGAPLANTRIFLLDPFGGLVPHGIPGEICISGRGVSRGYINNPGLTAEKFIKNSSSRSDKTYILYRTGDLGCWLQDGNIQFLGRIDRQVKIRGFRVEPGEIEKQLLKHENIQDAVVIFKADREKNKFICAYIVCDNDIPVFKLREYLSKQLPEYMIPSYFVRIEKIPLTASGKIDRKKLPEPGAGIVSAEYTPPGDGFEEKLTQIWAEVLGIAKDKISTRYNFFTMGGNSLNLIRMLSMIQKEFMAELTLSQIVHTPTIKDIANCIKSKKYVDEPIILLNNSTQKKFFCFPPGVGFGITYRPLANILNEYSLYSFNFIEDENRLNKYVEIITHIQPTGPYILFGWSAAGKLVFEVTRMLESQGREVSDIILADCLLNENITIDKEKLYEQHQKFIQEVQEAMEKEGLEFVKDKVRKKMEKYLDYLRNTNALEVIHANVHLLISEETQNNSKLDTGCWNKLTSKPVPIYNGFGSHSDMFTPGPLEKNANLIKNILNRIH